MRRFTTVFVLLLCNAIACALPGAGDIHLGSCIRGCNSDNRTCLNLVTGTCPDADVCFNKMELCFDDVSTCSDACVTCVQKATCLDEDDCNRACSKMAYECTDMIDPCIDHQRECVDFQVEAKEDCVNVLVECIATCVEDTENTIKGNN